MTKHAIAEDRTTLAGFEPETVLPSQLLDTRRHGAGLQPEKRLMLAVLEDAIATYQRTSVAQNPRAARDFRAVAAWFASDDVDWPCTYLNICHVLGFDPTYLRRGLDAFRQTAQRRAASGRVVPFRHPFRRISGSRTRAVVPRRLRGV